MSRTAQIGTAVARRGAAILGSVGLFVLLFGGVSDAQQAGAISKEPTPAAGPPQMRRLTEAEYRASIADIFSPDIPIVGRFAPGLREDGLLSLGTSKEGMSAFSVEQYDASARGIAAAVLSDANRAKYVPCHVSAKTKFDNACANKFVSHYGELLFRRPLTHEETKQFVTDARAASAKLGGFYKGLEFALSGMLISPQFLLRIERVVPEPGHPGQFRLDAYSTATRLSFFLTDSTPDEQLLRAAGAGELNKQAGLEKQVNRLIASPRYPTAIRAFFQDMLQFDQFSSTDKDPVIYPAYNSVAAADAQEQTLKTIVNLLIDKRGDYRDLFTTRDTFFTRALGVIYGVPVATRHGWEAGQYSADSDRSGILTDVSFLALHSHPGRSSATLRGRAIREIFLCQKIPDPPPNVNFAIVQDPSNKAMPTARIRLEAHRTQPYCASCHRLMDPIGLSLENFDGVGMFRSTENGALIDASGTLDGKDFTTPQGLGQAIHDHPQTPRCLVQRLYSTAVGRSPSHDEKPTIDYLEQTFQADGYRVPDLMRAIALSKSFYAVSKPDDAAGTNIRAEVQPRTGERS
jgi:hypothetical protein